MRKHNHLFTFSWALLPVLATAPLLSACVFVTTKQGEIMQREITYVHDELAGMQKRSDAQMAALAEIKEALAGMKESGVTSAGESKADFGVKMQGIEKDLAAMQGKLEEVSFNVEAQKKDLDKIKAEVDLKFDQFNKMFGMDAPLEPSKIPADKQKHWDLASSLYAEKKLDQARELFREYVKKYPDDALADDAQLMIGIAYIEEGRGAKALGELQKIIDAYPQSDRMDAVLYTMGEAFFMIQNCADARTLFKSVINQFPKSPFKEKAAKKVQEILKAPKSVCPTI